MSKTRTPGKTSSPAGSTKPGSGPGSSKIKSPTTVFITAALDMSWRLAIVVLVPIIGGFELDKRWHTSPALSILGFLMAGGGMALVLKQVLNQYGPVPPPKKGSRS